MIFAAAGWFVIHALWIGGLIAGVTALIMAMLGDDRARRRHTVAYAGLMLMVLLPIAVTAASVDFFSRRGRAQATAVVERAIGLPSFVVWRARVVRSAAIVWTAGLLVVAVRVAAVRRRATALRGSKTMAPGPAIQEIDAAVRSDLGVTQPVTVLISRAPDVPMVFGWQRSTILLPVSATATLDSRQLASVLAHELAHVQRRDYAANLVQVAADTVLWFHPAARWLSRRARIEREYCCDDVAVRVAGDPAIYARALATLEDARHDCSLVVAAASGTLLDRIQRIAGHPRPILTLGRAVAVLTLAIAIGSAVVTLAQIVPPAVPLNARLRSQTPPPASSDARTPITAPASPRIPQR